MKWLILQRKISFSKVEVIAENWETKILPKTGYRLTEKKKIWQFFFLSTALSWQNFGKAELSERNFPYIFIFLNIFMLIFIISIDLEKQFVSKGITVL